MNLLNKIVYNKIIINNYLNSQNNNNQFSYKIIKFNKKMKN